MIVENQIKNYENFESQIDKVRLLRTTQLTDRVDALILDISKLKTDAKWAKSTIRKLQDEIREQKE